MRAAPRPRRALSLARASAPALPALVAPLAALVLATSCARVRREGAWVDTTPNGFVAAPVDPAVDAGAMDAADARATIVPAPSSPSAPSPAPR